MFVEGPIRPDSVEHQRLLASRWIWEVSELGSTTRRADVEALKDFLTRNGVTFRLPYDRMQQTRPALASFVGTLNPDGGGFLQDTTGNRRFLVCEIGAIDFHYSGVDIRQLWAQILHELRRNPCAWRLTAEERAAAGLAAEAHAAEVPFAAAIATLYHVGPAQKAWWQSTSSVAAALRENGVQVPEERGGLRSVGVALASMGLERSQRRIGGVLTWGYTGIQRKVV
jgi:hypothetical protein